jgi:hypothetical protein
MTNWIVFENENDVEAADVTFNSVSLFPCPAGTIFGKSYTMLLKLFNYLVWRLSFSQEFHALKNHSELRTGTDV